MPGPEFLDTNVLVYAYDTSNLSKQRIARELVTRAVAGECTISAQVLAEFAATLLHKIVPPPSAEDVLTILDALGPAPLVKPDGDLVRRAVEARATYGLHFYDALIVAAAERANSEKIWSEDLNAGQSYFGAVVINPFA
jgi:predicted nucleic acid-binding protein